MGRIVDKRAGKSAVQGKSNGKDHPACRHVLDFAAEDGVPYDETTRAYLEALGAINENLAGMADRVVEVVSGIPVVLKEGGRMR